MDGDHEDERYPSFASVRRENLTNPAAGRQYVQFFLKQHVRCLPGKFYSLTDLSSSYGSIEHYLELGLTPNVIFLRRDPRLIAQSLFELDFLSKALPNPLGWDAFNWYPSPGEPGSLPIDMSTNFHSYQHCYWLCCDNMWRSERYMSLLPTYNCKTWEMTTADVLNINKFNSMLEHFDLPRIESCDSGKVDIYASVKQREVPPREFLHGLELDVLDRIPTDVKQMLLAKGWGQLT